LHNRASRLSDKDPGSSCAPSQKPSHLVRQQPHAPVRHFTARTQPAATRPGPSTSGNLVTAISCGLRVGKLFSCPVDAARPLLSFVVINPSQSPIASPVHRLSRRLRLRCNCTALWRVPHAAVSCVCVHLSRVHARAFSAPRHHRRRCSCCCCLCMRAMLTAPH
jgi:hypothetical protein